MITRVSFADEAFGPELARHPPPVLGQPVWVQHGHQPEVNTFDFPAFHQAADDVLAEVLFAVHGGRDHHNGLARLAGPIGDDLPATRRGTDRLAVIPRWWTGHPGDRLVD